MFSIPYFVVLINIYPSIVTIIHRILTYFRRNISLKHMLFKELCNISNKKAKVHAIFVQVIPPPSAGDNHCILFSNCYSDFDDRFYTYICTNDDTGRVKVIIQSLALTQELRAEDNVIAVIFFTNTCSEANRNRRLDYHDCFRVILNHQLDNCFNRRSIKEILLAVIVSALKFVRRSCSTVAYKAHLLPYVATYPLFRA